MERVVQPTTTTTTTTTKGFRGISWRNGKHRSGESTIQKNDGNVIYWLILNGFIHHIFVVSVTVTICGASIIHEKV